MRLIKILFLLTLIINVCHNGLAQAIIKFENTNYDFGKVAEGTQASHEFRFKNVGDTPLIISRVQASCGCTTPFWTKDPVLPGKEGVITASYNSKNRPGSFNKSITIQSNASEATTRVYIKGIVVPVSEAKVVYSEEELEQSARATVDRNFINLGKVEAGQPVPVKIVVENTGKKNLVIADLVSSCNCVQMGAQSSSVIHPGKKGSLELVYRPKHTGPATEALSIMTNDLLSPETKITLEAEVVESLRKTSILYEGNPAFSF